MKAILFRTSGDADTDAISAEMTERIFERLYQYPIRLRLVVRGWPGFIHLQELVTRQAAKSGSEWKRDKARSLRYLARVFSANLIAPASQMRNLRKFLHSRVTKITSRTGWLSEQSARNTPNRYATAAKCLHLIRMFFCRRWLRWGGRADFYRG